MMDEATSPSHRCDAASNKPIWPAVVGVLSCVLAVQAITGTVGLLLRFSDWTAISESLSSRLFGISPALMYVVFGAATLWPWILLAAGIVLLKEWRQGGRGWRQTKFLHLAAAIVSIVAVVGDSVLMHYSQWGQVVPEATSYPEFRVPLRFLLANDFNAAVHLSYPVFLLVWFWKR